MIGRLVATIWFVAALAAAAIAGERIEQFASDATVNADGSLTVREKIVWSFEDIGPKRGLLRDFPTRYKNRAGLNINVGFDVVSVRRDGKDEAFAVENIANGKRIRIGDKDVFLDEGAHTYDIIYTTSRQLGFFETYDEIYWNVTGNAWTMPIRKAMVVVRLPPGARIVQSSGYTGFQGESGSDFRVLEGEGVTYRAETLRELAPNEGFTVAVGFTKGVVAPPSDADLAQDYLRDNAGFFALIAGFLGILGYYTWAWTKVGRDPPKGTIIPLFSPPDGLGPAGARYVWRQGFDDKTFASAVVGLAVKGRAKIYDEDGAFAVQRLTGSTQAMTAAESALNTAMSDSKETLEQSNHRRVAAMRSALGNALDKEFNGVAFLRNIKWSVIGMLLSLLVLILAALLMPEGEGVIGLFAAVWTTGWWTGILFALWSVAKGFAHGGVFNKISSAAKVLFLVPFFAAGTFGPAMMLFGVESRAVVIIFGVSVLFALVNALFFWLMKAPTVSGRRLMDQIEGFRMYLATAEEDRLNSLTPPKKTPELFEKYLPYALALNCENEWAQKFTGILAAAGIASPAWYAGSHWNASNLGGFTQSVGSSLASATASSHTAPGSRSGSGGGGSSGGGGGGGGGSSW